MQKTSLTTKFLTVIIAQTLVMLFCSLLLLNLKLHDEFLNLMNDDKSVFVYLLYTFFTNNLFSSSFVTVLWQIFECCQDKTNKILNITAACVLSCIFNNISYDACVKHHSLGIEDVVSTLVLILSVLYLEKLFVYISKRKSWVKNISKVCNALIVSLIGFIFLFLFFSFLKKIGLLAFNWYDFPYTIIRDIIASFLLGCWRVFPSSYGVLLGSLSAIGLLVLLKCQLGLYFASFLSKDCDADNENR